MLNRSEIKNHTSDLGMTRSGTGYGKQEKDFYWRTCLDGRMGKHGRN